MPIIFLNLFVAVILQGFSASSNEEILNVYKNQAEDFKKQWLKYDPEGTGYIKLADLSHLIDDLEEKSKMIVTMLKKDEKRKRAFIAQLQCPTYHNFQEYYF